MVTETVDAEEIKQKLEEYTKFLSKVLRPDYEALSRAEQDTRKEIAEYKDLQNRLNEHTKRGGISVMDVDLGHRMVFCRATIDDCTTVFVHVGMGFHAELRIKEALVYVKKRIHFLTSQVLHHRAEKSKNVLEHIQSSERILDELSRELRRRTR